MKIMFAGALAILSLLSACASNSGQDRAGRAAESLTATKKMLADGNVQVDKTVAALNKLASVKSGDPKPAYQEFVSELDQTHQLAADVKATTDDMQKKGRQFFAEWEKTIETIQDPALKAKAKGRAEERSKEYAGIEESMGSARGAWKTFSKDLADLKIYFDSDLSPKGIEAAADQFKKANLDSVELKNALKDVSAKLDKVAADLAPGK